MKSWLKVSVTARKLTMTSKGFMKKYKVKLDCFTIQGGPNRKKNSQNFYEGVFLWGKTNHHLDIAYLC